MPRTTAALTLQSPHLAGIWQDYMGYKSVLYFGAGLRYEFGFVIADTLYA